MLTFRELLQRQNFVGQRRLIRELTIIGDAILQGESANIMLIAESGCGKTTLAEAYLRSLNPSLNSSLKYIPEEDKIADFDPSKRFHFFDEVHLVKNPVPLYPFLDSGNYVTIFATNFYDQLLEPLYNRCIRLIFLAYSDQELGWIMYYLFKEKDLLVPLKWCEELAQYGRGTPREVKNLGQRLSYLFKSQGIPTEIEPIHEYIQETLGTNPGGYTEHDRLYLEALESCDGTAGINTLMSCTGLSRRTLTEEVEPFLIMKSRIKITSRGRTLLNE